MKKEVGLLNAAPSKRLFLSIIADYDLNRSICELVDNGFDTWTRGGRLGSISIDVWLDEDEKIIRVEDTAGGLHRDQLEYMVGPGQSGSDPSDDTIGIFGVGTKRAVVALAKEVRITTRFHNDPTFQIEFDDHWLEEEDWTLPVYSVAEIAPGKTCVELRRLRLSIDQEQQDHLRKHLGATYGKFLKQDSVSLSLNGIPIEPRFYDTWSYPPKYEPRRYSGHIQAPEGQMIEIEVLAGLSNESSPTTGEYGVYFYCNDRLVAPAMKSYDVGFARGQAGLPHPKISLTKVIVSLKGDVDQMPWNSSKSDISTKHHIFVAIHDWLVNVVSSYAGVSRAWTSSWPDKVFAFKTGKIIDVPISECIAAKRSFLPAPPKSQPRFAERVAKKNQKLAKEKPWTRGLYEGLVASDAVLKQPLIQANWLAMHLTVLTLTSAFKEYIVHEAKSKTGETDIKRLLSPEGRADLRSIIPLGDKEWREVEQLQDRHDELFYARATPTISDPELKDARKLVSSLLGKLFGVATEA